MKLVVKENNKRIDKYISENTEYSRSYIEKLIKNGLALNLLRKMVDNYLFPEDLHMVLLV